jgi:hypothetical protein
MQLGCIHSSFRFASEVRVSAPPWGTGTALRVHAVKAISSYPDKKQRLARRTDGYAIRCSRIAGYARCQYAFRMQGTWPSFAAIRFKPTTSISM